MVMYYSFAQPRAVIWQMYLCTVAIVYACTGTAYLMSQVLTHSVTCEQFLLAELFLPSEQCDQFVCWHGKVLIQVGARSLCGARLYASADEHVG